MGLSVGEETRFGMNHAAEEEPKERRKNVIWFISDQHRGQAMGIHGDPNVSTPNMDWLAPAVTLKWRIPACRCAARFGVPC